MPEISPEELAKLYPPKAGGGPGPGGFIQNPTIPIDLVLSMDEFAQLFPGKSSCKKCWGKGWRGILKSIHGAGKPIKGKAKMKDGSMRTVADHDVEFCDCVLKKYYKHQKDGGEKIHVIQNQAISGIAPPNKGIMYFCSVHDKEVEIRDCHKCFMHDKHLFYKHRLACVDKNAVKVSKKGGQENG